MAAVVLSGSALVAFTATAATAATSGCTVTVVTTDQNGRPDPDVQPFDAPCRPGESNGDIETYNPYTDTYSVQHDVPLEPLSPSHSSSHGSSHGSSTSNATTPTCTPVAPGGSKIHKPTVQQPGHVSCPSPSSSTHPST